MVTHLFISYVREDCGCFDVLERHLRPLRAQGRIAYWHMGMVPAGTDLRLWRKKHLDQAQVILCLLSADYLAQEQQERAEIWLRQEAGAQVIPVIVRPARLEDTRFEALQKLPTNRIPISKWTHQDDAMLDVVKGVLEAIKAATPAAPIATGPGETAVRPSVTPPVGVTDETKRLVPRPTSADFPRPVHLGLGAILLSSSIGLPVWWFSSRQPIVRHMDGGLSVIGKQDLGLLKAPGISTLSSKESCPEEPWIHPCEGGLT